MKNINFNVSQDTIEKLSDDVIISDSYNYVCLIFNFDSSWSQYNVKKATFFSDYEDGEQQYEADIVNNVCVVPYEILQKSKFKSDFMVGVYGQAIQGSTLQQRNTTNMVVFSLRQGAYFVNALNPGEIDPSAYDLYLAKLQQIFQNGLSEYNSNAQTQLNSFNSNANEKIQQLNDISENVEQIEQNIEKMQENAKTSETNAKTSEENAQNSAKKALESENNIFSIQEDINSSKVHIDEQKEKVDESVKKMEKVVTEAIKTDEVKEELSKQGFVKNTDLAGFNKVGVVKVNALYGIQISSDGMLGIQAANNEEISSKANAYKPITSNHLDYAIKVGLSHNKIELNDEEKENAQNWLGITELVGNIEKLLSEI